MSKSNVYSIDPAGWKKHNHHLTSRNPFDSPSLSTSSLNESEHSDTSGQDEFHLDRYDNSSKYAHLRQVSRSTNGEERDRKPDLNIITNFGTPKMPMKDPTVVVNEVVAKKAQTDRKNKALSVVSQKAVQSGVSPSDEAKRSARTIAGGLKQLRLASRAAKRNNAKRDLQSGARQHQTSPSMKQVPFGITIPRADLARTDQNGVLPIPTPRTPAIILTPAGENDSWVIHRHGVAGEERPASSIYSAMPLQSAFREFPINSNSSLRMRKEAAEISREHLDVDSADSARPKSQGWWNLMLSPLLRAGSVASRKGRQMSETPPVPPLPFTPAKEDFSAVSARSDPSFVISATGTSPDTPRRLGLASTRTSTWSRWTEWEEQREANAASLSEVQSIKEVEQQPIDPLQVLSNAPYGVGLATEYFHACAVDMTTAAPYFECVGHSCHEQLPKLQSIYDEPFPRAVVLGSPFQSPLTEEQVKARMEHDMSQGELKAVRSPTEIEDNLSPDELSPNVRQANTATATIVRARALDMTDHKEPSTNKDLVYISEPPSNTGAYSSPQKNNDLPDIATVAPLPHFMEIKITHEPVPATSQVGVFSEKSMICDQPLSSPAPMSPEGEKALAPTNGVAMKELDNRTADFSVSVTEKSQSEGRLPGRPAFINAETEFPPLPERRPAAPITAADIFLTERKLTRERRRQRHEREDASAKKVGGLWRGRGCFSDKGCMGRGGTEHRTKRRWILAIVLLLLAIIVTSIVLAVTLTRKGDRTPAQSQWLNLTGYPPMPTGISTIATPNLSDQQKQCVTPSTMWSCSLPQANQGQIGSNDPDQPNFRFEIRFRNGTVPANMTIPLSGQTGKAGATTSDPFSNDLFVANPTPPNDADQIFIGRTTDNVTAPFDGETTPFYITFMSAWPQVPGNLSGSTQRFLQKRDSNGSSLLDAIPAPARAADGSAAPASLLPTNPYPISQPVKLYNRGLRDEHYGFYIYYDKSIYLSGVRITGNNALNGSIVPAEADQNGGSTKSQANAMCTFSQTRFVVKIFTNPAFGASLLPPTSNRNITSQESQSNGASTSSATDFDRPGSFPYPTTILIDRHGGDIDSKAVYCYGLDDGDIVDSAKILTGEIRKFGGQLINPAPDIIDTGSDTFNATAGGIDGGTGGCFCNWQNWQ